jgi:hypothetical protein
MPPTRSTPADDDHHCTRCSNHRKHADAPNEEPISRRSPLYKRSALDHRAQADALAKFEPQPTITPARAAVIPTIVNKSKPSPRSTSAEDHHCTSGSNPPSQTRRCSQRGAHQLTITTALTAAVATIACKTDASHEEHTTADDEAAATSTIVNEPMLSSS